MADITLKVSTEKYQARIATLQGYVNQLETLKGNYQSRMKEIPSIWSDSQADEYYKAINTSIEKVQKAIDAAELNIEQLKNIITNTEDANRNINSSIADVQQIAENLFK